MRKPEWIQAVKRLGNNSLSTSQMCFRPWLGFHQQWWHQTGKNYGNNWALMNLLLFEKMEFSKCTENAGTANRKLISLEILPLFTQGDTAPRWPGRSERSSGTKSVRNWGSEREIIGESQFQGQQELWGFQQVAGEDTSCRITRGFPPAQLSTLLSRKATSWFISCPDYWSRLGVRINVLQLWWGVDWAKHREVSEQDTPPGNTTRTQDSHYPITERSFSPALCVHSAFLTALAELHLHRLFPRGLQGKCHENVVIDLSKDEPPETRREGGERNPKDKFIYLPREGRGRISSSVCSAWGRVCYQPVK